MARSSASCCSTASRPGCEDESRWLPCADSNQARRTIRGMRRLLLLAIPALLCATDLKIDHATVAGHDLKKMQAALEAVGIPTVYGGPHANGVTEMALASFPDGSYLELIAVQATAGPHALDRHEWAQFLKTDGMPCGWAVQTKDLAADRQRLQAAGVTVSEPVRAGR